MALGLYQDDDPLYKTSDAARAGLPVYGGVNQDDMPAPPRRMALTPPPPAAQAAPQAAPQTPDPADAMMRAGYTPVSVQPGEQQVTTADPGIAAMMARGYTPLQVEQPPPDKGNFRRGLEMSWEQLKQTGAGTAALAGDTFGLEGLKNWGIEKYKTQDEKVNALSSDNDDIFKALSKDGSFTDWAGYASGYLLGQVAQVAVGGGVGGIIGKMALQKGAQKFAAKMIERKAGELVAEDLIAKGASEQAAKASAAEMIANNAVPEAVRNKAVAYTAQMAGAGMAAYGVNATQEVGGIYGSAQEEAEKTGVPPNLAKVWGAGLGAAALDTFTDMGAVGRVIHGAGHGSNIVGRVAKAGLAQSLKEAATEGIQTVMERWGANQSMNDTEAWHDIINSAAMGAFGGAAAGAGAGVAGRSKAAQQAREQGTGTPEQTLPEEAVPDVTLGRKAGETLALPHPPAVGQNAGTMGERGIPGAPTEAATSDAEAQNEAMWEKRNDAERQRVLYGHLSDDDAATMSAADAVAAKINAASKAGDVASAKAGAAELVGNAQKALNSIGARPDIYATLGQVQSDLDGLTEKHGQQAPTTPETSPEPQSDIAAQVAAMGDPAHPKDAVFVAKGTPVPKGLPAGVTRIAKPEGTYLTTNPDKAATVKSLRSLTEQERATFLDVPEGKPMVASAALGNATEPLAVSAKDAAGNVVAQAATDAVASPNTAAVAAQTPAGGSTEVAPLHAALGERAGKVATEATARPYTDEQNRDALRALTSPESGLYPGMEKAKAVSKAKEKVGKGKAAVTETPAAAATVTEPPAASKAKATSKAKETAIAKVGPAPVTEAKDIHALADEKGIAWDDDKAFMAFSKKVTGKEKIDDMTPQERQKLHEALQARPAAKVEPPAAAKAKATSKAKETTDAVQKPSAAGVLQPAQKGTGEAGRERGGVESGQQGKEAPTQSAPSTEKAGKGAVVEDTYPGQIFDTGARATLHIWTQDGTVTKAELHGADGSITPVNTKRSGDTLINLTKKLEGTFIADATEGEGAKEWKKGDGKTQQTKEKNAAIKRAAKDIARTHADRKRTRLIAIDASPEEREAFINAELSSSTGQDKNVTFVDTPDYIQPLVTEWESLLHQKVQFFSPVRTGFGGDGFVINGDPDTVYVSVNNTKPHRFLIGHEIAHNIGVHNPKAWAEFRQVVKGLADKGELKKYERTLKRQLTTEAKEQGKLHPTEGELGATVEEEISADAMGTAFMDPEFWSMLDEKVDAKDRPIVVRIMKEVAALARRFMDVAKELLSIPNVKPGVRSAEQAMFADTKNLNRAVRDLITAYRGDRELTYPELRQRAGEVYMEKFYDPDTEKRHVEWNNLSPEAQEYFTDIYDLYRDRDVSFDDLGRDFDRVNDVSERIETAAPEEVRQTLARAEAKWAWNTNLSSLTDPDFDDLSNDHKNYFIRAIYNNTHNIDGPTPAAAYTQVKDWRAKKMESISAEQARTDELTQKRSAEKAAAEKSAAKEDAKKEKEKARLAVIASRVANNRKGIEARRKNLSAHHEEILEKFYKGDFEIDKDNIRMTRMLHDLVNDTLVDPQKRLPKVPDALKPVVREIIGDGFGNAVKFRRKDGVEMKPVDTDSAKFKKWWGKSAKNPLVALPSGEPRWMYHGTAQDIMEFRAKQADAIFVTPDPRFADGFADMSRQWMVDHADEVLTDEQKAEAKEQTLKHINKLKGVTTGERSYMLQHYANQPIYRTITNNMMPSSENLLRVYARAEFTFDYENENHVDQVLLLAGDRMIEAEDNRRSEMMEGTDEDSGPMSIDEGREFLDQFAEKVFEGHWPSIEDANFQAGIKEMGFDSFTMWEGGRKNLAVYDPNQLKSAISNTGEFSTEDPRISYSRKFGSDDAVEVTDAEKQASRDLAERLARTRERADETATTDKANAAKKVTEVRRANVSYSRKDLLNPVEVYAMNGGRVVGMASFNATTKTWQVFKALPGPAGDIRNDYTEHGAASTEDALNLLRDKGVRLVKRKESPTMRGQSDAWGRGPDALLHIDATPQKANNWFTKSVDAALDAVGLEGKGANVRRYLTREAGDAHIDVYAAMQDIQKKHGIISADNNIYQKISLYSGQTGEEMDTFKRKFADPVEGELTAIVQKGGTVKDAEAWLRARHAPERNDVIFKRTNGEKTDGAGISTKDANALLRSYANKPYAAELQKLGDIADAISVFKVNRMEESGLISKEVATALRQYEHYVPLKGLDDDDTGHLTQGIGVGTGFSGKGTLLHYALSRNTEAKHTISHMLLDAEAKIVRANKNVVANAVEHAAEDYPDPNFWVVNPMKATQVWDAERGTIRYQAKNDFGDPNSVTSYRNGIGTKIELKNPEFAQAITNSGAAGSNHLLNGMRKLNQYYSMMMTSLNPEWMLVNGMRDALNASFNIGADKTFKNASGQTLPPGMGKRVAKDLLSLKAHKDIKAALTDPDNTTGFGTWYKQLEKAGGLTKFHSMQTLEERVKGIADMEQRITDTGFTGKLRQAYEGSIAQKVATTLAQVNDTVEAAPRVLAYKNLVEAGWSKADAADYAKNLTVNFNRRGKNPYLSSAYLFFNPGVQGSRRLWQALHTPQGKAIASSLFAMGLIASVTGNAGGGDDDKNGIPDYQELSDWERSTNIILWPHGPKIPLPYGWNAFYAMGNYLGDTFFGAGTAHSLFKGMKAVQSAFNPFGGADSKSASGWLIKNIMPTAVDPLIGLYANENSFGSQISRVQDTRFGPKMPQSQMGSMSATSTSKAIASGLNTLTGGNAAKAGLVDVSPDVLDYLAGTVFPGMPTSGARLASTVVKAGTDQPLETKDLPVVRRMWAEPSKGGTYDALADAKQQLGEFLNIQKNGDAADRTELAKSNPHWAEVAGTFQSLGTVVGTLQKRKAAIIDDKVKVADKQGEINKIDQRVTDLNNRMLLKYKTVSAMW